MSPYKDAQAQRDYQRRWVANRRAEWMRGQFCEWCRSESDLEVHHRDPSRKVHHAIWSWGEARRATELAKCVVLCRSCHRSAHSGARRVEAELRNPHGTRQRYLLGCKCDLCRAGNVEYERSRKARHGGVPS